MSMLALWNIHLLRGNQKNSTVQLF